MSQPAYNLILHVSVAVLVPSVIVLVLGRISKATNSIRLTHSAVKITIPVKSALHPITSDM